MAARPSLALFHGAGSHADHPLMRALADACAAAGAQVRREALPFRLRGPRALPNAADAGPSQAAIRACAASLARGPGAAVLAGHSYGARQLLLAAAQAPLPAAGLVLFAFPLHGARRVDEAVVAERAALLPLPPQPLLLVVGDRDRQARPELLMAAVARARRLRTRRGLPALTLLPVPQADHGFAVPRRSGLDPMATIRLGLADWFTTLEDAPDAA
jgi:predicted alpha/beta-hydrolase family hydrolase